MGGHIVWFILFAVYGHVCCIPLQLKQVIVLSRHNLRTPLTSYLSRTTTKEWPKLDAEIANLTPKGVLLEGYMGEYFSAWLRKEGLFTEQCPLDNDVFVYSNTRQRTKATAAAFTKAAFHDCDIKLNFKNTSDPDPVFFPAILNTTDAFKQNVVKEMQEKLNRTGLEESYLLLNNITDINNSEVCKVDGICDLTQDNNEVSFEIGEEPNVTGSFFIATAMVDTFMMSLYEGLPMENVAWGKIHNEEQWKILSKVIKENLNVRFNLTAAKDLTKPLLKCMKDRLESNSKFNLLVGHDSNLIPVIRAMEFKPYELPEQYEPIPIGSKLVFQKWTDGTNDFLKVEFVYQSWQQLRNAEELSLSNPPKKITMSMKKCVTDTNGFCDWRSFEQLLSELV